MSCLLVSHGMQPGHARPVAHSPAALDLLPLHPYLPAGNATVALSAALQELLASCLALLFEVALPLQLLELQVLKQLGLRLQCLCLLRIHKSTVSGSVPLDGHLCILQAGLPRQNLLPCLRILLVLARNKSWWPSLSPVPAVGRQAVLPSARHQKHERY